MNVNRLKNVSILPGFALKKEDTYIISKNYYNNVNNDVISDDIYIKLLKNIIVSTDKKKINTKKNKKDKKDKKDKKNKKKANFNTRKNR